MVTEFLEDRTLLATSLVVTTLSDEADGVTVGGVSLRDALAAISDNGTITFDSSLANGTIFLTNGELSIANSVVVDGTENNITIDAQGNSRVLRIDDGNSSTLATVSISGLTLTGGSTSGSGGGIFNVETTTLTNTVVSGNSAVSTGPFDGLGGGIFNFSVNGELTLARTTVSNNYAIRGGGIENNNSRLTISNSVVSGNTVVGNVTQFPSGGGIRSQSGSKPLTVIDSTIADNVALRHPNATSIGGGLHVTTSSTAILVNSTVSGNFADFAGGINNEGTLEVINSTLSDNTAQVSAGGIFQRLSVPLTVVNSTIFGNTAIDGTGGGIFHEDNNSTLLDNSIVAGNVGGDLRGGGTFSGKTNLIEDGTVPAGLTETVTGNPMLGPLQNNGGPTLTHAVLSGSPVIDAGSDSEAVDSQGNPLSTDQRGQNRFVNSVDIGAFEFQSTSNQTLVVDTLLDENDGINSGGISLRDAIVATANGGTISFDPSQSGGSLLITNGPLLIDKSLRIEGTSITIDAQSGSRVFTIDDGSTSVQSEVILVGLTITGGTASIGAGAGIFNNEILVVSDVVIQDNFGDGIVVGDGAGVAVNRSRISNNQGSGIRSTANIAGIIVLESTISGNTADFGGGIYQSGGSLRVTNSTISGNSASFNGGGIYSRGTATVTNSTVSGNRADEVGAGILNFGGDLTVTNSTIFENSANDTGGGIYHERMNAIGSATLNNTIVAGNIGGDVHISGLGAFSGTNNLIGDGSVPTGLMNTVVGDPMLGPLQNNGGNTPTHELLFGSPAINAGANSVAVNPDNTPLTTDQRGSSRFVAQVDIGAVESLISNSPTIVVNTLIDENDGINTGDISLRDAIAASTDGGTIVFDPSLANGQIVLTHGELVIDKSLTIDGNAALVSINAQFQSRVFRIDDGDANTQAVITMTGISIGRGGSVEPNQQGGGIFNSEILNLTGVLVTQNFAFEGAGIYSNGTLNLKDSIVSSNTAETGGGIYSQGPTNIVNTMILENSVFTVEPIHTGGGIFIHPNSSVNISDSTITRNKALFGGGIYNAGKLNLVNSTVSGNNGFNSGGGLYSVPNSEFRITNTTIANNTANIGGGIRSLFSINGPNGDKKLDNTIVADNIGGDIDTNFGTLSITGTNNLIGDGVVPAGLRNTLTGDPKLAPLQFVSPTAARHALLADSPAADAGSGTAAVDTMNNPLQTDQLGQPRLNGPVDIGAFESLPFIFTVTTTVDEMNGISDGSISLREAIANIAATGTITFDSSLSGSTIELDRELLVNKPLTIDGTDLDITLDAQGMSRILNITDGIFELTRITVSIAGLTLTGGRAPDLDPGPETLENSGGAIYNTEILNLTDVTITGNSAAFGGGISNSFGILTLTRSSIQGNTASESSTLSGGGIFNLAGRVNLFESRISGNVATNGAGGGIANVGLTELNVDRSTIDNNSAATDGGGIISLAASPVNVTNSTISGNSAANGGGIFNSGAPLNVTNSTIFGNVGGGVVNEDFTYNNDTFFGEANLNNTIIAGSTGRDLSGDGQFFGTNNLVQDGMIPSGLTESVIGDPILEPLQSRRGSTPFHALTSTSPAIDAGNSLVAVDRSGAPLVIDQRGRERRVGTVDIGSFELLPDTIVVNTVIDENDGINIGDISLRDALATIAEGGTISFAPSLAGRTISLNPAHGELVVNRALTIDGDQANITIDAQNNGRVFRIDDGEAVQVLVTLSGLTIQGGIVSGTGDVGGGILNLERLNVVRSTITANTATAGAGIANRGDLNLVESQVFGNTSFGAGGGILNNGMLLVMDSTISSNNAGFGGGIANESSQGDFGLVVTNSTLSQNTANGQGGGIFNTGSQRITNSTFFENSASTGGGILNEPQGSVILNNTIVAGSSGSDLAGTGLLSGTNNLIQDGSGSGLTGTITGDPLLGPLQNNGGNTPTHALLSGSPALNAGSNAAATNELDIPLISDQRGRSRFVDAVDIGAVEMTTLSIRNNLSDPNELLEIDEGNTGARMVRFIVDRQGPTTETVMVSYTVVGDQVEANDFLNQTLPSGVLTFAPGESQQVITFFVTGDEIVEQDESFTVRLSNVAGDAAIVKAEESAIIKNDDSATISLVGDVVQNEGNGGGEVTYTFTAELSNAVEGPFTVAFATSDGTAKSLNGDADPQSDKDYISKTGALSFAGFEGERRTLTVEVNRDSVVEAEEFFNVTLGAITAAQGSDTNVGSLSFGTQTVQGVIRNDDVATLRISGDNATRLEGTGATQTAFTFLVSLDRPVAGGVLVSYETNDGPFISDPNVGIARVADGDYIDNDGFFVFPENDNSQMEIITVNVNADNLVEATELFHVLLTSALPLDTEIDANAVRISEEITGRQQPGTILNRNSGEVDDQSQLDIQFDSVTTSNAGVQLAQFTISSSQPVQGGFFVDILTDEGTSFAANNLSLPGAITSQSDTPVAPNISVFFPQESNSQQVAIPISFLDSLRVSLGNVRPLETAVNSQDILTAGASSEFTTRENHVLIMSAGPGGGSHIKVIVDNQVIYDLFPFGDFQGGVRVTTANIVGDATPDIVTVPGPGGGPIVKVFDGATGAERLMFGAYDQRLTSGLSLAAGDFNGDGRAEIVTAPDLGAGSHVRVFDLGNFQDVTGPITPPVFSEFFAYDGFTGGVRVAVGNITGDPTPEIITAPATNGGPIVRIWDVTSRQQVGEFAAYSEFFDGGIFVATGDFNNDGFAEIVTGPNAGGGPIVRIFNPNLTLQREIAPYPGNFTAGVRVAVVDTNRDGQTEIVTVPGAGNPGIVRFLDPNTGAVVPNIQSEPFPGFPGGLFLGSSSPQPVGAALQLATTSASGTAAGSLTQAELSLPIEEAASRAVHSGGSPEVSPPELAFDISELAGRRLGEALETTVLINAAGYGDVDPHSEDDFKFTTQAPEILGRADLLSALEREIGQAIGYSHIDQDDAFLSKEPALETRPQIDLEDHTELDAVFAERLIEFDGLDR